MAVVAGTTNAGTFFCVAIDEAIPRTLLSSIVGFQIVSGFLSEAIRDGILAERLAEHVALKKELGNSDRGLGSA
jgi:hypothetical protein